MILKIYLRGFLYLIVCVVVIWMQTENDIE